MLILSKHKNIWLFKGAMTKNRDLVISLYIKLCVAFIVINQILANDKSISYAIDVVMTQQYPSVAEPQFLSKLSQTVANPSVITRLLEQAFERNILTLEGLNTLVKLGLEQEIAASFALRLIEKGAVNISDLNLQKSAGSTLAEYIFKTIASGNTDPSWHLYSQITDNKTLPDSAIKNMVALGTSIDHRYGPELQTALHAAVQKDNSENVRALLENKAHTYITDAQKNTPLHYVRSVEIARLLLEHDADVTSINNKGYTPLHLIVMENRKEAPELIRYLVTNAGADINVQAGDLLDTPLHMAVRAGPQALVKALVTTPGIDKNIFNRAYKTPAQLARSLGRPDLEYIITHSPDAHSESENEEYYHQ